MNLKLKALLLALGVLIGMFLFIFVLVFHSQYVLLMAGIGLIYGLYRLILQDLEYREQRKKK
jgi:hypothetical protein